MYASSIKVYGTKYEYTIGLTMMAVNIGSATAPGVDMIAAPELPPFYFA